MLDAVAAEVATGHLSPTTRESLLRYFPPSVSAPVTACLRNNGEATPALDENREP